MSNDIIDVPEEEIEVIKSTTKTIGIASYKTYKLDISKIHDLEDVKQVLDSMGILYTGNPESDWFKEKFAAYFTEVQ